MSGPVADSASIPLSKASNPASSVTNVAGIEKLNDLVSWSRTDLAHLHGMGPRAIRILEEALRHHHLEFAAESRDLKSGELCHRV